MAQEQEFVDFEVDGLDIEGAKEFGGGGFYLVPAGHYLFEVTNVVQENSKSSNAPMVVVYATVIEGQETDEAAKETGQTVRNNYSLSPKAIGRLKQLMIACGAPLDKFRAGAIFGAKFRADVIHSTGDADVGPDGQPREARVFANLANEKPLGGEAQVEAAPPPPVTRAKAAAPAAAKPAGNNSTQARRA